MSDEKLLPCPFCGGEPELHWINEAGEVLTAWVRCKCGCEHHERLTREVAVKKWNSRHLPDDAQASPESVMRMALEACNEYFEKRSSIRWSDPLRAQIREALALPSTASEGDGAAATQPMQRALELLEEAPAAALRALVIEECAKLADLAADTLRRDAARAQSLGVDCSDSGGTLDHYAGMYEGMASLIRALKTSTLPSAMRGSGWRPDCPACVASKLTCDQHYSADRGGK